MESRLSDESIVVNDGKRIPMIGIPLDRMHNPGVLSFRYGIPRKPHVLYSFISIPGGEGPGIDPYRRIPIPPQRIPSRLETSCSTIVLDMEGLKR
jgi:hypothetical protein